jgi:hypothetical protein
LNYPKRLLLAKIIKIGLSTEQFIINDGRKGYISCTTANFFTLAKCFIWEKLKVFTYFFDTCQRKRNYLAANGLPSAIKCAVQ